jgi:hypothetical protein
MTMPILIERAHDGVVGDLPQPDRPSRRRFSVDYKLAILADYERLSADGAKGALLRREGSAYLPDRRVASGPGCGPLRCCRWPQRRSREPHRRLGRAV